MKSWKEVYADSDFSIYNLPWGIYSGPDGRKQMGMRIGDEVINLGYVASLGILDEYKVPTTIWYRDQLNDFIALGKKTTSGVRNIIQQELCNDRSKLKDKAQAFIPMDSVTMHMPLIVGDYTDFYSSIEHATNVGKMFRDPENALLPNWKHLPVGYHGRASSIVVSGTDIHRPIGQIKPPDSAPILSPTQRLDFELEMGTIIGKQSSLGSRVSTDKARDYIFGMVIFNDWSARDIQKWEYVPLGPFLGKSFASSISPWIVPIEALEHFKVQGPDQEPPVLDYLKYKGDHNYDLHLEVIIRTKENIDTVVCRSNFKYMYWNMLQQVAHHTVNGCNLNVGDIMASGTISGKDIDSYGSMLELSWGGKNFIQLNDGTQRTFLENGDTVIMRAYGDKNGVKVGFGSVKGKVLEAMPL
ncbi:MAG: fumarylacetoacetase [Saprospiraceae bacterium]|nr:fumarylacetoacetase [Saprospiraceae bacterium]